MTARIVDLAKWREEHPPLVRLAHIAGRLCCAGMSIQSAYFKAWLSLFIVRR